MVTMVARQQSSRLSPPPLHPERDATCPLDQAAQFLLSIPAEEAVLLKQTREFHSFLRSLERLKQAHQRITPSPSPPHNNNKMLLVCFQTTTAVPQQWTNGSHTSLQRTPPTPPASSMMVETAPFDEKSFLQTDASDDVLHRIMDYLESCDLVRAGTTCRRYHHLIHRHVERKCPPKMRQRQLSNTMQLLRCAEQMDGVAAQQPVELRRSFRTFPFHCCCPTGASWSPSVGTLNTTVFTFARAATAMDLSLPNRDRPIDGCRMTCATMMNMMRRVTNRESSCAV